MSVSAKKSFLRILYGPIKNERICNIFSFYGNKWMILKKKTLKRNPSNRTPISYSTEFKLDINLNNFEGKLCVSGYIL